MRRFVTGMEDILHAPSAAGPFGLAVKRIDTSIRYSCAALLWITFLVMLFPTFANAFLRYATDASIVWSEQTVRLIFPWFIMGGAVLAAQHSRHIGVTVLAGRLGQKMRVWLQMLVQLVILVSCIAVFDFAIDVAINDDSMYTLIGISQSWGYMALVFGYALLAVTALTTIYRLLTDSEHSERVMRGAIS